jgi:hypothetical protein
VTVLISDDMASGSTLDLFLELVLVVSNRQKLFIYTASPNGMFDRSYRVIESLYWFQIPDFWKITDGDRKLMRTVDE